MTELITLARRRGGDAADNTGESAASARDPVGRRARPLGALGPSLPARLTPGTRERSCTANVDGCTTLASMRTFARAGPPGARRPPARHTPRAARAPVHERARPPRARQAVRVQPKPGSAPPSPSLPGKDAGARPDPKRDPGRAARPVLPSSALAPLLLCRQTRSPHPSSPRSAARADPNRSEQKASGEEGRSRAQHGAATPGGRKGDEEQGRGAKGQSAEGGGLSR